MPDDTTALRNLAERLLAIADGRKRRPKDPRPALSIRFLPDELIAIANAAAARGISRSDLVRQALVPVIGRDLHMCRDIPANFQRRKKPDAERFHPTDSDVIELTRAATAANLAARAARDARNNDPTMMTEAAARSSKLMRRSGG